MDKHFCFSTTLLDLSDEVADGRLPLDVPHDVGASEAEGVHNGVEASVRVKGNHGHATFLSTNMSVVYLLLNYNVLQLHQDTSQCNSLL